MGRREPDLLVTNMWALETRLMETASTRDDINVEYLRSVKLVVADEAHEYRGLSAGLVSMLLRILRRLSGATVIISSATIPSPKEFASKLLGVGEGAVHHHDFSTEGAANIQGKRLVILGLMGISPLYSWSTYVQLWSVMMAFIHYAYSRDGRRFRPQAIVFLNNIKEIRRVRRGYEENISLGEPRDHIDRSLSALDGYAYHHYLSDVAFNQVVFTLNREGRLSGLLDLLDEMHSEVPQASRERVITALKSGTNLAVVLSTSSLELGVDYENVSFILNVGLESPISMAQRIGRGGRSSSCLRTVLGLVLSRRTPQESFVMFDPSIWGRLDPAPQRFEGRIPVATDNPQVIRRGLLTYSITLMAEDGDRTHASGSPIRRADAAAEYLTKVARYLERDARLKEFEASLRWEREA